MAIMRSFFIRSVITILITQSLLFVSLAQASGELALPTDDFVAPKIEHTPITKILGSDNGSKEIRATVTDNVGVKNVVIFYRIQGSRNFSRMHMNRVMGSGNEYTATLAEISEPGIEYYIQAEDFGGNKLLKGHSFEPLTIKVENNTPLPTEVAPSLVFENTEEEKKGISKWVWIGLGALAVGAALAGGGGGDDSGGSTTNPSDDTVSLTITAAPP